MNKILEIKEISNFKSSDKDRKNFDGYLVKTENPGTEFEI